MSQLDPGDHIPLLDATATTILMVPSFVLGTHRLNPPQAKDAQDRLGSPTKCQRGDHDLRLYALQDLAKTPDISSTLRSIRPVTEAAHTMLSEASQVQLPSDPTISRLLRMFRLQSSGLQVGTTAERVDIPFLCGRDGGNRWEGLCLLEDGERLKICLG